ncbi:hypothetical protein ACQY0O_000851 [Thecaphora frezii]
MDPTFGQPQNDDEDAVGSAPGAPRTPLSGLAGTQSERRLTQREVEALRNVKRNVDGAKTAGWIIGGAVSWYMLSRRKPRPSNLQLAGLSFVGAMGASFLLMPFGILMSKGALQNVEDPQHLKRVLAGAIEEKRRGGILPPARAATSPSSAEGEQGWNDASGGNEYSDTGSFAPRAEASHIESAPYSRASGSILDPFYPRQDAPASYSRDGPTASSSQSLDSTSDGEAQPSSRWAQLRNARGVEPSKWELIRQENARNAYNRRSQSSTNQSPQEVDERVSQTSGLSTLPGANIDRDPRWSSTPARGSSGRAGYDQLDGWGSGEFVQESGDAPYSRGLGGQRQYNINSVNEEDVALSGFEVDSNAPFKVAKGSLLAALAGAVSGSVYGIIKGQTGAGTIVASRMGFNMFAFGFPFFAIREYAVNPGLALIARENRFEHPTSHNVYIHPRPNPHTCDLASSGISGAIVGGGLAGFARGRQLIPSGIIMFGLACTGLQFAGNELRFARQKLLTREAAPAPAVVATPSTASSPSPVERTDVRTEAEAIGKAASGPMRAASASTSGSTGKGWLSTLKSLSPVRSVSDEEYEAKLQERLRGVDARLAGVREELRELELEEAKAAGGAVASK